MILEFKREATRKELIERIEELEMENKELLTRLRADGLIERDKYWIKKIQQKIEEIIQGSSRFNAISPLNYNKEYYETRFAVEKLQELLKGGANEQI